MFATSERIRLIQLQINSVILVMSLLEGDNIAGVAQMFRETLDFRKMVCVEGCMSHIFLIVLISNSDDPLDLQCTLLHRCHEEIRTKYKVEKLINVITLSSVLDEIDTNEEMHLKYQLGMLLYTLMLSFEECDTSSSMQLEVCEPQTFPLTFYW